jgi:hypothetical protein
VARAHGRTHAPQRLARLSPQRVLERCLALPRKPRRLLRRFAPPARLRLQRLLARRCTCTRARAPGNRYSEGAKCHPLSLVGRSKAGGAAGGWQMGGWSNHRYVAKWQKGWGGGVRSEAQIRLVPLSVASCPAWVCFIRTTLADASRCSSTRAACSASSCFCSRLTAPCSSLLAPPSSRSCFSAPRRASSDSAAACAYGPAAARTTDGVGPAEYTVQRPGEEEAQTAQAWT